MLPSRYAWLAREPGPKMIVEALKLFGTMEKPGAANNPTIVAWAKEVGGEVADVYKADSIPWCGLFMAVVAKRAGKEPPKHPLWALSWSAFGAKAPAPALGDVLVFVRSGGGHVGLYALCRRGCVRLSRARRQPVRSGLHHADRQGPPLCRVPAALSRRAR